MSVTQLLTTYNISPTTGFTSDIIIISNDDLGPWLPLAQAIPTLQPSSDAFRRSVAETPTYTLPSTAPIQTKRAAFVALSFIAAAYLFSSSASAESGTRDPAVLPACISAPLLAIAEDINIPPHLIYASYALWNLAYVAPPLSFTGSVHEKRMLRVLVEVERAGGRGVEPLLRASRLIGSTSRGINVEGLVKALGEVKKAVDGATRLLVVFSESDSPAIISQSVWPLFAGTLAEEETARDDDEPTLIPHLSTLQSPFPHVLDILLGISHDKETEESLEEARDCMPVDHARFLSDIASLPSLSTFMRSGAPQTPNVDDEIEQAVEKLSHGHTHSHSHSHPLPHPHSHSEVGAHEHGHEPDHAPIPIAASLLTPSPIIILTSLRDAYTSTLEAVLNLRKAQLVFNQAVGGKDDKGQIYSVLTTLCDDTAKCLEESQRV